MDFKTLFQNLIGISKLTLKQCNTPGVCHSLSSGFDLKYDRLSGDEPDLKLDVAPLLYI
jgi:hypothetical protein